MTPTADDKLLGLIGPSCFGGISGGGSGWRFTFELAAWKDPAGRLHTEPLQCALPADQSEIGGLMQATPTYSIVEVEVKEVKDFGELTIFGCRIHAAGDSELERIRDELQQPITLETERFGILEFDRGIGIYEGFAEWCGSEVGISLSCSSVNEYGAPLGTAEALFRDQDDWKRRVNEFAADRLLPLKNGTWLEEDEAPLSREDLIARMSLNMISVDEDGESFTFWHDDGDLFWGHSICVYGTLADGLTDADIPG